MNTPPIIFIIFNRPDTTSHVFESIRAAKPKQLLVVADGARGNRPGEAEKCTAARAIVDCVDWDCDVQTNFSTTNMGCRLRVSSGITWAFGLVEKAIILEDDCVPSPSFFRYCAELLDRYEDDQRVMMISGDNHLFGQADMADSYYFSRYPHVWGWATWRRAWMKYDLNMEHWPEIRARKLFDQYLPRGRERDRWNSAFESVYDGKLDTWDYQWVYSIWANSGLSIAPAKNLIRNIGFHAEATHTQVDSIYSSLDALELDLPLRHPATLLASSDRDDLEGKLRIAHSKRLPRGLGSAASTLKLLARRVVARQRER